MGFSSRQDCIPAGEGPAVSITRFGYVAMPQFVLGNRTIAAWCIRPCRFVRHRTARWGIQRVERAQEPEHNGMSAAPIFDPRRKMLSGTFWCAEHVSPVARPTLFVKKRVHAAKRHYGGRGPSDCARNAGTKSGRTISQQGLAATCRDLSYKAQS